MSRSRRTKQVNIAEAKANLSGLIETVLAGGEVIIARRNAPVARLVAVESARTVPRFGALEGRIHLSDDFDAPLSDFAEYE